MLLTQQQTENVTNPPQNYEQNNFIRKGNMYERNKSFQRKNKNKNVKEKKNKTQKNRDSTMRQKYFYFYFFLFTIY